MSKESDIRSFLARFLNSMRHVHKPGSVGRAVLFFLKNEAIVLDLNSAGQHTEAITEALIETMKHPDIID